MVAVAILAAGRGTRMKSSLPKVLHSVGGKSMVERVLDGVADLNPSHQLIVVGFGQDQVKAALAHIPGLTFVEQREQLGTGHAVQQLIPHLEGFDGDLLVLNGDVPLLRPETIQTMVTTHQEKGNAATLLTAQFTDPTGYGRVFCADQDLITEIIEHRDCNPAQRQNPRINAGIYCFNWAQLMTVLPHLSADNDQQEYYLTDVVKDLAPAMALDVADGQEIFGINSRKHLAEAYAILQDRIKDYWMATGVTLIDPGSTTIDTTVQIAPDVVIEPQTHLRGKTFVGTGSRIGPGSLIENSQIGAHATIAFSVVSDSTVGRGARVGPYAHLRGEAGVGEGCRIGNFVEIKKATLGAGTNVAHLSYLGDATLGNKVNVGAGTITANYDGYQKHQTVIGDRTKTGSNSVLVAPVTIGNDVTIAAGSVVRKDAPDNCLVVSRAPQKNHEGWQPRHLREEKE
ncbi:bifunctional UDP-N-acetylglucosamine diphosphorylase/glucosamine-1-phosphate N-acetyltransferase GlmU [Nodosilinea sp. LEGE 07088]|uniref:bifunctional UDP-N-acetylglucosamine diphosphorylase/glucosamine-1-phosphate N-acetyltransferase GlmU n=1 Tax=Nodosilinea sp. LEGE 07088 TaxID=2777968 RepID=UPI00187E5668|nr:bifunctional UDP-N-acetylglucosamine diphosphorylase/glucosamine-1-phosphate N-acetyltransferase GlmU [Nodosilinea sp. LEGE 07088]MBE9140871.1 bifunctional UDP-N-acetylglucosamine diphosphorylase/glucosamine-1-phosphate N-acetyltransferase GlmU [Nodosilinea sp. LEGE 07088]